MNNTVTLDGEKLKKVASSSHTAQVVALSLAMRERLRHTSDITRTKNALIRSGERIVESDYEQFWEDLQAIGAGSIIYGRNGKQDRFKWHYSLKKVAEACIEGNDVHAEKLAGDLEEVNSQKSKTILRKKAVKHVLTAKQKEEKVKESGAVATASGDSLVYVPLRPNFDVEIKVPQDLTRDEVEVLARALSRRAM